MKLKKNDKIILIVGIVILIVAGAGIAFYTMDDPENKEVKEESDIYTYSWMKKTSQLNIGSDLYATNKIPYEALLTVNSPSNTVLTKIDIELSWEDDGRYGLLNKNKGLDTLDAELSQSNDVKTISSVGGGNETITFTTNTIPMDDAVEANSESDAMDVIEDMISGHNKASFDVKVTVTPGEKIWRPLKWIRDKGNDFSLTAFLTYYTYDLEETNNNDDSDDDTKETGYEDYGHQIGEFYINLGYGRGMI